MSLYFFGSGWDILGSSPFLSICRDLALNPTPAVVSRDIHANEIATATHLILLSSPVNIPSILVPDFNDQSPPESHQYFRCKPRRRQSADLRSSWAAPADWQTKARAHDTARAWAIHCSPCKCPTRRAAIQSTDKLRQWADGNPL